MNANNPYQQMAKQFMDLWQEQLATMITDKEFVQSMLDLLQKAPMSFNEMPEAFNPAKMYEKSTYQSTGGAAPASGAGGAALALIEQRLASIEKRLAALESAQSEPKRARNAAKRRTSGGTPKGRKAP